VNSTGELEVEDKRRLEFGKGKENVRG